MPLTGRFFVASKPVAREETFSAIDPSCGEEIEPAFSTASAADVAEACKQAEAAFATYAALGRETRARFIEAIAAQIMDLGDELLERAHVESGLPMARLTGERGRTVGQLKLFAAEVRDGAWMGVRKDSALPDRQPMPRAAQAARNVPLGPVAVFGASNFPLAFSVAGGDTASALAAGCPVVVKGHPAHPGTSELIGTAIARAVEEAVLPGGVFSLLNGTGYELGQQLVSDPRIKAVGFTGSRGGGLALMKLAAERPEPIPVYAEMSAINPVVLLPGVLEEKAEALGEQFAGSLTMGAGQFCTNPGVVLGVEGAALDRFVEAARTGLETSAAQTMLTPGIHESYEAGVARLSGADAVDRLARAPQGKGANQAAAALFGVNAAVFTSRAELSEEVFGPSAIVVRHKSVEDLATTLATMEGQLTASVHFNATDETAVTSLLPVLERKVGRIIANGWPTGVEVCHSMVHGGPYPATSDSRTTSVGTLAINRFLRPVCYQNFDDNLLPASLQDGAADGVMRRLDGEWTSS